MEYAFIGAGNMGRALAAALIGKGVCPPEEIVAFDPDEKARERFALMGCAAHAAPNELLRESPVAVLAVKPQTAPDVYGTLRSFLQPDQVVVSIMAGVPLARVREGLGHEAVVRVMPNTPAQVGLGMNVYIAPPPVTPPQVKQVEAMLEASGESLRVDDEDAIDAATAVSGSGPAYVFYLAEHWINAAIQLGFKLEEAELLVQQTLIGATALWKEQRVPAATLREQVTSKGGTTAAALDTFNRCECGKHLQEGIVNAYRRAKELAG